MRSESRMKSTPQSNPGRGGAELHNSCLVFASSNELRTARAPGDRGQKRPKVAKTHFGSSLVTRLFLRHLRCLRERPLAPARTAGDRCQKVLKGVKRCQKVSKGVKRCQRVPNRGSSSVGPRHTALDSRTRPFLRHLRCLRETTFVPRAHATGPVTKGDKK